jgi:hypothetical protein
VIIGKFDLCLGKIKLRIIDFGFRECNPCAYSKGTSNVLYSKWYSLCWAPHHHDTKGRYIDHKAL